ncbi:MAG: conjugal transfer protein TrbL, partial [Mycetocola reblochoni]
ICAAAIVWFSLLIRKALILVAVVMAPIALSGASWDATKGWFGKWASFVLALIFSKLVIVVVFLVAINQVNAPIDMDLSSIADPIAGIVLMFIAAFAPYMVYKFISFVGFDMYHVMSAEQESKQAMNRPMPLPGKPDGGGPQKILDGGSGSKNDGGGNNGGGSGNPPPPSGSPQPAAGANAGAGGGTAAAAGGAAAGSGGAAAGGGGAAAAGGAGAGAAAGPVGIAAVAGAKIAKGAAEAGPKLGGAIGRTADGHAGAASEGQATPPPPPDRSTPPAQPTAPAPSAPAPKPQAPPANNGGGGGQAPPPPKPAPKT